MLSPTLTGQEPGITRYRFPPKTSEKSILMIRILKLPPEWAIPTPRMKIPGQTDTSLKAGRAHSPNNELIIMIMSSLYETSENRISLLSHYHYNLIIMIMSSLSL